MREPRVYARRERGLRPELWGTVMHRDEGNEKEPAKETEE